MEIDLFTLAAQIVNFIILILLLKHFLYGRIVRAMDERQQRISGRLEEARKKKEQADDEMKEYRRKKEELDDRREEILAEARDEASRLRDQLEEDAREEVGALKERWKSALERDRESFLRHLRETTGREFRVLAERAFKALADRDLVDQIVGVFLDRLEDLESAERDRLIEAARKDQGTVRVHTPSELAPGQKRKITSGIHSSLADDLDTEFSTDDDLICGVELAAGGLKVAWSVDTYLDALEERLGEVLESKTAGPSKQAEEKPSLEAQDPDARRKKNSGRKQR